MNEDISKKLWVVKFCIKVVYPKYNHYTFLVFLAIKFRIWCKKTLFGSKGMDKFEVKTIPSNIAHLLVSDRVENKLPVVIDKCIIISKEQYIQLCSENLFYVDNGLLWLGMKLSPEHKINQKHKQNISRKRSNILRYNLNLVTSEIHKKLWSTDNIAYSLDSIRIVPVVGSKQVLDNIAFTNENEFHNIFSSFGIEDDKIAVTFHPLPSLEYAPKIAMTAEVSLIVNEFDISNDFTKELLNNFFEVPKLVSINDVFSIELTQETTGKYHYKYLEVVQTSERLYFKCNKLVGDAGDSDKNHSKDVIKALFVVKGVTQLSLGENIHMLKPKQEFFNVQDSTRNYDLIDLCPTGLKYKFEALQEAIGPFITGDMGDLSSSLSSPIIPMLLLTGALGSGRHLIVKTLAKYNGMNYLSIDCNGLQSSTAKQTESKINATVQKAKASSPVIVVLDNFEVFAVDPENNEDCRVIEYFLNTITDLYINYTKHLIIFIAITEGQDLKPNILRLFLETFHINKPNSEERYEMLEWFFRAMQLSLDDYSKEHSQKEMVSKFNLDQTSKDILRRVAAKTETFLYGDLDTLLHFAMRESYLKQLSNFNQLPPDPDLRVVKEEDFDSALESIRNLQSQHLDAPKIPKVYWEDIGGLEKLKKEILKTIEFPIKYPHLFKNSSLKRSGILMYGPPGCGKTLVAKAVSTELNVSFLSVKGPELLNMYIGQSEENVRKVFQTARSSTPCIIFLDEVDAVAPRRGAAGDSGGAADRVVSQLLAELDGVQDDAEEASVVFVMGATNRPDLVERSLLRPGRLDTAVYVGPYVARQRHAVLAALCSRLRLRPEVDLQRVCDALPERCTGADLMAVVSAARAAATRTLVHNLQTGVIKESDLSPDSVIIGVSEMWQGVEAFKPSVSDEELDYYESLQSQM